MIFGHVVYKTSWNWLKWRFGYERSQANYRNWITIDFDLWFGPIHIEGWLPEVKTL
jgi:hypothetical protein